MAEKKSNPDKVEKRLQIVFGIAIALVVIGLVAFFALAAKEIMR